MTASPDTGELPAVTTGVDAEGPLIPSPTEPPVWFVSLVPPKDSLPLDFDPLASPPTATLGAAVDMVAVETEPAPATDAQASPSPTAVPVTAADAADVPPRLVVPAPRTEADPGTGPSRVERLRRTWQQGLPTSLVVLLVAALLAPGVLLDVARDGSFGLPSTVLFLLAASGTPLVLRPRSLASGVVLQPLAFAATAAAIAWRSGLNHGSRQIGLDAGTTMATHAPLVFAGTATALLVVLTRVTVRLVRR